MKCDSLSASKIESFMMCPFKYYLEYIRKIKQFSGAMTLGKMIHTIFEKIGLSPFQFNKCGGVHNAITKLWDQEYNNLEPIDKYYAFQKDYDVQRTYFIKAIESTINRYGIDLFQSKDVQRENRFDIVTDDGIHIRGIFDFIFEKDDKLYIIDWKSGKYSIGHEKMQDDVQIRIYDLAAKYLFPKKNIVFVIDFIRKAPAICLFSDEQRRETEKFLLDVWIKIIRCKRVNRRLGWQCNRMCYGRDICDYEWKEYQLNKLCGSK